MRYCSRCIIPESRPHIEFDRLGVCNACRSHGARPQIDWAARGRAFGEVVRRAQVKSRGYDCVIPVSGGKDSTWQVVECLRHGLNPLAVTWKTPARSSLGSQNLANLVELGVDHIDYQVSPTTERQFLYKSFVRFGSTAIPMHMALFSIPLTVAARMHIPLVVWGENSATEYGGECDSHAGFQLDDAWLSKYGVTHGTKAEDWIDGELTRKAMSPYFAPTAKELADAGVLAVFLGYYFPWDPETSLRVAREHGFAVRDAGPKTGYYNYADIDDDFISIHHWLKWYKFGFTRLFDNLSLEIRNERMTRSEAIEVVRTLGLQTPHDDIERLCAFLRITVAHFYEIAESFRNQQIWTRRSGQWIVDGFLIDDWSWDEGPCHRSAA